MRDSKYRSPIMQLQIVQKLFSLLLTSTPADYRESSSALRAMHFEKLFQEMKTVCLSLNASCSDSDGDLSLYYLLDIIQLYTLPLVPIVLHRQEKSYYLIRSIENSSQPSIIWGTNDVWSSEGKDYSTWISVLSHQLIWGFFAEPQTKPNHVLSSEMTTFTKVHAEIFHEKLPENRQRDIFLSSLAVICLLRSDIAQEIFPLVVLSILKNKVIDNSGFVADKLTRFVLSPSCQLPRATILGCKALHFLLRQNIKTFIKDSCKKTPRVAAQVWTLPYSFTVNINFKVASEAAMRCNAVCTALLFAELSAESANNRMASDASINRNANVITNGQTDALVPILREIHDPDAIYGVDLTSSLELQALMFAQKQQWMEALLTYESINSEKSSAVRTDGIMRSLHGLGAYHALSGYVNDTQSGNPYSSEISWRLGEAAVSSLSQWSDRVLRQSNANMDKKTLSNSVDRSNTNVIGQLNVQNQELFSTINGYISSCLSSLAAKNTEAATQISKKCRNSLFNNVLKGIYDETAKNVVANFSYLESLTEISEVCECIAEGTGESKTPTIFKKWNSMQVINFYPLPLDTIS